VRAIRSIELGLVSFAPAPMMTLASERLVLIVASAPAPAIAPPLWSVSFSFALIVLRAETRKWCSSETVPITSTSAPAPIVAWVTSVMSVRLFEPAAATRPSVLPCTLSAGALGSPFSHGLSTVLAADTVMSLARTVRQVGCATGQAPAAPIAASTVELIVWSTSVPLPPISPYTSESTLALIVAVKAALIASAPVSETRGASVPVGLPSFASVVEVVMVNGRTPAAANAPPEPAVVWP
jgi:hypothetical protein